MESSLSAAQSSTGIFATGSQQTFNGSVSITQLPFPPESIPTLACSTGLAFNSSLSRAPTSGIVPIAAGSVLNVSSSSIPHTLISTSNTSNSTSTGSLVGNVTLSSGPLSSKSSGLIIRQYPSASSSLSGTIIISESKGTPNASVIIETSLIFETVEVTTSHLPSVSTSTSQVSLFRSGNGGKSSSSTVSSPSATSSASFACSSTIAVPSSHVASTTTPAIEATTPINMFQMNFWHKTDKNKKSIGNLWYMYIKELVDINSSHVDLCQSSGLVSVQNQNTTSGDPLPSPIPYPERSFALPFLPRAQELVATVRVIDRLLAMSSARESRPYPVRGMWVKHQSSVMPILVLAR